MTMQDRLIELLKKEWVSPLDALQKAQCFSLAQRCSEFRRRGMNVVDRWVDLPSGKKVKAYHIEASA
jgi:hypothetical protein